MKYIISIIAFIVLFTFILPDSNSSVALNAFSGTVLCICSIILSIGGFLMLGIHQEYTINQKNSAPKNVAIAIGIINIFIIILTFSLSLTAGIIALTIAIIANLQLIKQYKTK